MSDRAEHRPFAIPVLDPEIERAAQRLYDAKTKPPGSLGALEALGARYAAIRGEPCPPIPDGAIVVMAGDHGVAAHEVSAYPREVTAQMVANFARGGAAINVLARHGGLELVVVDVGVATPLPPGCEGVRQRRLRPGTRDFTREPAMTQAETAAAIAIGRELAGELVARGRTVIGLGEMGIGNTTVAAALTAAYTGAPIERVVGRGTGVDAAGLERKRAAVAAGLERHKTALRDPMATLSALGGYELAGLAGVVIGAAEQRALVVLDGYIATAAALAAAAIVPAIRPFLVASHLSEEPGHAVALDALGLQPHLLLDMRLGEGTGAALMIPIVRAAVRILHEMATFEEAGVSRSG